MLSEARIQANRRNAQRSTGPRTDAGKARARQNALKHGLTGSGLVQPAEEAAEIDKRTREWSEDCPARTAYHVWLLGQVVLASIRLDRCGKLDTAHRGLCAERAASCWDDDRRLSVEQLAVRLPRNPALVVCRLRQTRHGCDWLIARWNALAAALDHQGTWNEAQLSLALDLLGVPPLDRDIDPARPADDTEALRELVRAEIQDLESCRTEGLDDLDATERALAEAGLPVDTDAATRLLRRYEAACRRTLERGLAELWANEGDSVREETETARPAEAIADPAPTPPPAPPPDRPATDSEGPLTPSVETARRAMAPELIASLLHDPKAVLPIAATPIAAAIEEKSKPRPHLNRQARRALERQAQHST